MCWKCRVVASLEHGLISQVPHGSVGSALMWSWRRWHDGSGSRGRKEGKAGGLQAPRESLVHRPSPGGDMGGVREEWRWRRGQPSSLPYTTCPPPPLSPPASGVGQLRTPGAGQVRTSGVGQVRAPSAGFWCGAGCYHSLNSHFSAPHSSIAHL